MFLHHSVAAVAGAKVQTIERLDPTGTHRFQTAWLELQVPRAAIANREEASHGTYLIWKHQISIVR